MEPEAGPETRLTQLLAQARSVRDENPDGYLAMVSTAHAQKNLLGLQQAWELELMLVDGLLLNGNLAQALRHCHRLKQDWLEGRYPNCPRVPLIQLCIRCHDAMGQYEQAMQYRQELFCMEEGIRPDLQLDNLLGIARFHNQSQHPEKALTTLKQALNLFRKHPQEHVFLGHIRSQQGQANLQLGKLNEALTCLEAALSIWAELGLLRERGEDLARLAAVHHAARHSHQALEILQQALLMLEGSQTSHRLPAVYLQAARIHADLGQKDQALHHALTALKLAEKHQLNEFASQAHQLLVDLHEQLGQYQPALKHMRAFHQLEQQIFSEKTHQRLVQLELDHALQKSEQEKALYQLKTTQLSAALKEAEQLRVELEKQAHRDQLTQLYNRHYLVDKLNTTFRRSRKDDQPLTLVLADLDHFKQINDQYSHSVGDQVLMKVAELLQANLRQSDVAGRYGGEEFLLILPDTDEKAALRVCEKLRHCIHRYDWEQIAPSLKVTISMGICAHATATSHEELLQIADRYLYAAKAAGRNRVLATLDEHP